MTNLENLQSSLFWLIFVFIIFAYFLPSLSSFLKEKLTGKAEEEKFDLDQMVHRKQEAYDRLAQEQRFAFERKVFQSKETQTIELLKEINWGEGPAAQELVEFAKNHSPEQDFTWQQLRASYHELLSTEAFNQSDNYIQFPALCQILTSYTVEKSKITNPEQKESLFLELHKKISKG